MKQLFMVLILLGCGCSSFKKKAAPPDDNMADQDPQTSQLAYTQQLHPDWVSLGEGDQIGTFCSPVGATGFLRNYSVSCPATKRGKSQRKTCSGPVTCKIDGIGPEERVQWTLADENKLMHACSPCK